MNKNKGKSDSSSSSSSSSSDDENTIDGNKINKQPCRIDKMVIYSNYSNNENLKFTAASFSFFLQDDSILIIQFHPMFLWRLIHYQKNDCNQFKTHISKYLTKTIIIYIHPTFIFHNNIKRYIQHELYVEVTTLYYRLHNAIKRNYEIDNILDELLQKCVDALIYSYTQSNLHIII